MSNIALINTSKTWGGGEKWFYETALALVQENHKIYFLTQKDSDLEKKLKGLPIEVITTTVNNLSFLNPLKLKSLSNIFKTLQLDSILINLPSDLKTAGIAGRMAGIPNIIYRRGNGSPIKNSWLNRFLLKRITTSIVANSEATKKSILINHPYLEHKIKVIYNGINPDNYAIKEHSKKEKVIIGNIGRLSKEKRQDLLIPVAQYLLRNNLNFEMHVIGNGSLYEQLQLLIKKNKLESYIKLKGFIEDIPGYLPHIDILIHLGEWEGFGFVITEAMASGVPIVTFDHSSYPEIVENNKTGFLTDHIDSVKEKVATLIEDANLRKEMGMSGRKRVEEKFSNKIVFPQLLSQIK